MKYGQFGIITQQPEKALGHCFYPWHPAGRASRQVGGRQEYLALARSQEL